MSEQFDEIDEGEIVAQPDATVEIPEPDVELVGSIFHSTIEREKTPGVLFIHGWHSSEKSSWNVAKELASNGITSLTFNFRGHDKSEGDRNSSSREDFVRDAVAAFDFLKSQPGIDPENITVCGRSFGSYIAILFSKERPDFKNLVLSTPADYPDENFDKPELPTSEQPEVMDWRREEKDWSKTKALRALHEFDGMVHVIEADNDEQVPHQTTLNYINAIRDPQKLSHVVIPNATHIFKSERERIAYNHAVASWVIENQ